MKIQCDVCGKEEATIFCTADEAALCQSCDYRVHNANKLASKHPRFPLLHPQVKESPLCDICQKRRALLFCQEDRALLCRDCDVPIHKANEHTKKHNRFVLTGIKISAAASSSSYQKATTSSSGSQTEEETKSSLLSEVNFQQNLSTNCSESSSKYNSSSQVGSYTPSNIAEYLVETLPGWHVEEFWDPSSHYGYYR